MKLTVLGSNASSPSRTNPASGYLVEFDGRSVWMDAGPGTFMRLSSIMDPGLLDAVVLSHTHVDHCADLVGLYGYLACGPSGPTPIPVYAPEGSRDLLGAFARADEGHVFHQVLVVVTSVPYPHITDMGIAKFGGGQGAEKHRLRCLLFPSARDD